MTWASRFHILWFREPDPAFAPGTGAPAGQGVPRARARARALGLGCGRPHGVVRSAPGRLGRDDPSEPGRQRFTLYAYGARLAIDSGYANYLEKILLGEDFEAARSSQTEAHNAHRHRRPDAGLPRQGRAATLRLHRNRRISRRSGRRGGRRPSRLAHRSARRADRYFIHVRGEDGRPGYLVIGDAVQGFGPKRLDHDYRWFLQTEPGNRLVTTGPSSRAGDRAQRRAPRHHDGQRGADNRDVDTFTADYADIGAHPRAVIRSRAHGSTP